MLNGIPRNVWLEWNTGAASHAHGGRAWGPGFVHPAAGHLPKPRSDTRHFTKPSRSSFFLLTNQPATAFICVYK